MPIPIPEQSDTENQVKVFIFGLASSPPNFMFPYLLNADHRQNNTAANVTGTKNQLKYVKTIFNPVCVADEKLSVPTNPQIKTRSRRIAGGQKIFPFNNFKILVFFYFCLSFRHQSFPIHSIIFRIRVDGICISSRYFVTVRRAITIPASWFNFSASF